MYFISVKFDRSVRFAYREKPEYGDEAYLKEGPKIYQAKSAVNQGWVAPKVKVAQNGLKHILVLGFLKSNEICECEISFIGQKQCNKCTKLTDTLVVQR